MKILLIRVSSLGDVLHNMPIVNDLLRHFPDAQIDWVVEEAYVHLVRLNLGVQQVFPFALRRWRKTLMSKPTRQEIRDFIHQLRAQEYDLVLDTQGLLKTGIIMGMAKIAPTGKKVGLANGTEGSGYEGISRIFHTASVAVDPRTHAVLRGRLVAAHAGDYTVNTPASFGLRQLYSPSQTRPAWMPDQPYAVFFHGTAGASKKWARENWIHLAKTLQAANLPILLPWGNATEKAEAEQMAAQIPDATVLPQLSMQDAIILAQAARIAIGVDTGLTHIAAAYETSTIEIYCDSPRWKTEGNWSDQIVNLGDKGQPASAAEVELAVQALLSKTVST
ncbi:lipopolysaccharide heptosyltransferase I [Undibacterium sp. Xuan67W]|uniref:lipopolysaccharide heptosyltransferase I n=1 Tax=Undibacterium sp. Xuan67W TaxID=3413057 RepID=UPI003BF29F57